MAPRAGTARRPPAAKPPGARGRTRSPRQQRVGEIRRSEMSKNQRYIVGLDIGTSKICCLIAEVREGGGADVVGIGTAPSRGLRKGVVVNFETTVEAIKAAVEEAEL